MKIKDVGDITPVHLDVLSEVGNIGAGNAATALSDMLHYMVKVTVPSVRIVEMEEVAQAIGDPSQNIAAITINLDQDLIGTMLSIFHGPFANELVTSFIGTDLPDITMFRDSEMGRSVLCEVGNITVATYVNALSQLSKLVINILPPHIIIDTLDEVIKKHQAREFKDFGHKVVVIDESFIIKDEEYKSSMILLLEIDSLNALIDSLGVE
ncbi:MAG: chemotaxis protein CheC [Lachnospiraceae bacterium]|jgi:chemotaxis protein CheC|nr:chemotaxis protein CheC [Lachnospiraceae bacterium]